MIPIISVLLSQLVFKGAFETPLQQQLDTPSIPPVDSFVSSIRRSDPRLYQGVGWLQEDRMPERRNLEIGMTPMIPNEVHSRL